MLRVIFMGSPEFAVPTLSETLAVGHDVVAVYSQPPRPAGRRGLELKPTPVHAFAEAAGLKVLTPKSLKGADVQGAFRAHQGDVAVVVAYGLILPEPILEAPRHGCLNLHPSLLPRWRGAAPIQRAVMAGDEETAVMVMRMDAGLDTGPVCLGEHATIGANETAGELHDRLARDGAQLMVRALSALERGTLACTPQSQTGVTYAEKIDKAEARIDWARPARELHNLVRGLAPHPGAWFETDLGGAEERFKVLRTSLQPARDATAHAPGTLLDDAFTVACLGGALRLETVQRAGRRAMTGSNALKGAKFTVGQRL